MISKVSYHNHGKLYANDYVNAKRDRSCIQSVHKFIDNAKKKNKGIEEIADFQTHLVANLVDYNPLHAIKSVSNRAFNDQQSKISYFKATDVTSEFGTWRFSVD